MSKFLYKIGRAAYKKPWYFIVGWLVVLGIVLGALGLNGISVSSEMRIEGTESQKVLDQLTKELPEASGGQGSVVFTVPDGESLETPERAAAISKAVEDVYSLDHVSQPRRLGPGQASGRRLRPRAAACGNSRQPPAPRLDRTSYGRRCSRCPGFSCPPTAVSACSSSSSPSRSSRCPSASRTPSSPRSTTPRTAPVSRCCPVIRSRPWSSLWVPMRSFGLVVAALVLMTDARFVDRGRTSARHRAYRRRYRSGRSIRAFQHHRPELSHADSGSHDRPGRRDRLRAVHRQPSAPPDPRSRLERKGSREPSGRHGRKRGVLRRPDRHHRLVRAVDHRDRLPDHHGLGRCGDSLRSPCLSPLPCCRPCSGWWASASVLGRPARRDVCA